uniref:Uncharacterized protein n=1 Tax=Arundo donax TaxID=35708 RepID=A0A0A8ZDT1_ARUDO
MRDVAAVAVTKHNCDMCVGGSGE